MTLTLTNRDQDLLDTLTRRVPMLAVEQAAGLWWPRAQNRRTAGRRLGILARAATSVGE